MAAYIAKVPIGTEIDGSTRWRYFYTRSEYNAYLKNLQNERNKEIDADTQRLQTNANNTRNAANAEVDKKYKTNILDNIYDKVTGGTSAADNKAKQARAAKSENNRTYYNEVDRTNRDNAYSKQKNTIQNIDRELRKQAEVAEKREKRNSLTGQLGRAARKVARKAKSLIRKYTGVNVNKVKNDLVNAGKKFIDDIMYEKYTTISGKNKYGTQYTDFKRKRFGKNKGSTIKGATYTTNVKKS